MTARHKRSKSVRRVLITDAFFQQFTEFLDFYAKKSRTYPRQLNDKLQNICLPQLKDFPESGSPIHDILILKNFVRAPSIAKALKRIHDYAEGLSLREIILDKNCKILYGYDKKIVVLLAIKHTAKRRY